jgi:hypothetical protein
VRLHADGHAEPGGQRHGLLEDPCRGPEPVLARRRRVQVAAEHPHERGIPVAGQLEEPAQVRTRVVTGEADRAVHRDHRQPGRGQGPPDLRAAFGGRGRIDELAVNEPEFDAGITPAAARGDGRRQGGVRKRQGAEGDARQHAPSLKN